MAKNTTKKIKELKKEKPSKITNEELNQVQSATLQEKLGEMQVGFEKTYGTADINIQDGTINHKEDVKTD